jgi:CheY-like chemotaxis protein
MKRRILLVDDDLAVLLTLKAVLELHGFEVETAVSSAEAVARMDADVYQMVISDLHMETEDAGLAVIRAAHRQAYAPATALLTAYAPSEDSERSGPVEHAAGRCEANEDADAVLIKPVGASELLREVEALLGGRAN